MKAKIVHENGVNVLRLDKQAGGDLSIRLPDSIASTRLDNGRDVIFGIRPEAITDRDGADRNSKAIEMVEAQVEVVEPAGSDTFVVSHLGGKEVTARMRSDVDVRPGQMVNFAFNLDKAVLFDPTSQKRL